jgi:hypothetical protein
VTPTPLLARLRAAGAESVLLRGIHHAVARLTPASPAPAPSRTFESETEWLSELGGTMQIARGLAGLTVAVQRAWRGSSFRRRCDEVAELVRTLPRTDRVRAAGVWAVAAALTDGILTPLDPRPASVSRWALWAGLLVLGSTAAIFAGPVVAAWTAWRTRRLS